MKTLKKIISLSLILTLIITTFVTNSVFASITFNDVNESTAFSQAIYNLVEEGVLDGYANDDGSRSFKPEATITRSEFAKVIVVAKYGKDVLASATTTNFSDMEGNWSIPYVAYASGAGIINGYPDGTFGPNNPVTYAEAVKMIVCALGYGPVVQATEPWYQGYINIANSIGLTKGAVGVAESPASRGLVAQLIDNMSDCKTLVQSGVTVDGKPSYSVSSGNEITGQEIFEDEGVLVGVYDNTLRGTDTRLTKNKIDIDNEIYTLDDNINYEDLVTYLGQAVTFKWYEARNTNYITSIRSANDTDVYTVDAFQIDSYNNGEISFFEDEDDDDTTTYSLASDIFVVYNGYGVESDEITADTLEEWLELDCGTLTFYNNDGDKDMDVVYIEKYETFYVNAPVTNKGVTTITDKIDSSRKLALDEDEVIVTKISTAGGNETEAKLTNIANNNIVSVAVPLNTSGKTTVKISAITASGSIDEMTDDYEGIKIGTKEYETSKYFQDLLDIDEEKYGFGVGSNVKFYLDFTGKIVYSDVTVTTDPYGYLIDYVTDGSMGDGGVTVRLLNTNNKLVTYELKSKVRVNGNSMEENDALEALMDSTDRIEVKKAGGDYELKNSEAISQVIKYKTGTEDGKTVISEILTVGVPAEDEEWTSVDQENGGIVPGWFTYDSGESDKSPFTSGQNSEQLVASGTSTTKTMSSQDEKSQFTVNSSTIVFRIPFDRTDTDEYRYSKGSGSFSNTGKYYVEPYDITGTTAAVVVYYMSKNSTGINVGAGSNSYIVVGKKAIQNDDGKSVHELSYVAVGDDVADESKIKTAEAEDTKLLADYKAGDVIRMAISGGVIEDVEKVFVYADATVYDREGDAADGNKLTVSYNGKSDYFQAHLGKVYAIDVDDEGTGSIAVLNGDSQDDYSTYSLTADTKYYKLDDDDVVGSGYGEITEMDTSDYESATNVLVISYDNKVKGVYVITEE